MFEKQPKCNIRALATILIAASIWIVIFGGRGYQFLLRLAGLTAAVPLSTRVL